MPFADDWAYLRIADTYVRTGTIRFVGWNDIALLGELPIARVLAAVFGGNYSTYRLISVGAAFIVVVAHLQLQRMANLGEWAWVGTLLLVLWPGFLTSSVTMMTDLPALAAQLTSLVLLVRACSRKDGSRRFGFLGALGIAFVAVTIRQNAVVALITVIFMGLVSRPLRWVTVLALPAVVASYFGFFAWRGGIPNAGLVRISPAVVGPTLDLFSSAILFGLMTTPLTVRALLARRGEAMHRRAHDLFPILLSSTTVAGAAAVTFFSRRELLLGNTLTPTGPLGEAVLSGSKPALFPAPLWWSLVVVGAVVCIAGLVGAFTFGRRWLEGFELANGPSRFARWIERDAAEATLAIFAILNLALIVFWVYSNPPIFDRYLFGFVAAAVPLLMRALRLESIRRVGALASACLMALVVLSFASVWDAYSFSVARWKLGENFVSLGGQASSLDAGFEWVGAHYPGIAEPDRARERPIDDGLPQGDYLGVFPKFVRTAVVLAREDRDPSVCLLQTGSYSQWFGIRRHPLFLYVIPDNNVVNSEPTWSCAPRAHG